MEENLQQPNRFVIFFKQIWPQTSRTLFTVFYATMMFIRNTIRFMISQLRGY
ncbi:MAG TPA: hypothetical protein VLF20_04640 [Patescibacteria group bacterium]|nr:hypothetical protein [Patescibacteria group bacterium]